MKLFIKLNRWDEAVKLAAEIGDSSANATVYLPYAQWLASNDRFDDALNAYQSAGRPDMCLRMLEQLTHSAIVEKRFKDGGYYYWKLAQETLQLITHEYDELNESDRENVKKFQMLQTKADLYFAYSFVHSYTDEPFTSLMPEALFQVSRFLLNTAGKMEMPFAVSRVFILYTLAKQSKILGAFKLARFAYERLGLLKVPLRWADQIDMSMMTIQAKPYSDKEDLLPACYRCGATNPLINSSGFGDKCGNCGHRFLRSFVSFDILALVEFAPEDDVMDDEAEALIKGVSYSGGRALQGGADGIDKWQETDHGGDVQTMQFGDDVANDGGEGGDLFSRWLMNAATDATKYRPVTVDRKCLSSLRSSEVFIVRWKGKGLRNQYYKNMIPEISIALCENCNHFFHQEEYEISLLKGEGCPYCRHDPRKSK